MHRNIPKIVLATLIAGAISTTIDSDAKIIKNPSILEKNSINRDLLKTTEEKVLVVNLAEGDNISDLTNNPDAYTKIIVNTTGNKKLDSTDFTNLKTSTIADIDLSNAKADSIPNNAFKDCTWLTSFKYPSGVTTIGSYAFSRCSSLGGELVIPNTVTTINDYAFQTCSSIIGDLNIPNSVTTLGAGAFKNCSGFNGTLNIGSGVTKLLKETFGGCSNLTGDLIIPDNITSIYSSTIASSRVFNNCSGLNGDLIIGGGINEIKSGTFEGIGCEGSIIITDGVTSIGQSAFINFTNFKGNITIPDTVTTIGNSAFNGCSNITGELIIPSSVKSIGNYAFAECSGLTGNLNIPPSLTTIGNYAFNHCGGFRGDLVIPNTVTSIGEYAFMKCGFDGSLKIGSGITSIPKGAFRECSNLTGDLIIPDNITSIYASSTIASNPFYRCDGLTGDLVVGSGVTTIKRYMFTGIGCMGDLILKEGLETIDSYAFAEYTFEGELKLPNTLTTIGSYAFNKCVGFNGSLIIPDSVTTIGINAFEKCTGFDEDIIIGLGLTSVETTSFSNTTNVKRIIISTGDDFVDSNYRKTVIDKLDKTKTILDLSYNFNEAGTWIETETIAQKVKPIVKMISNNSESDFNGNISEVITLEINTPYKESNMSVMKDGQLSEIPKLIDNKYRFNKTASYVVTITTTAGAKSIINFELINNNGDIDLPEDSENTTPEELTPEKIVEIAEKTKEIKDIDKARDLINQLPESDLKDELQDRLDAISPSISFEKKSATAHLDVYIKNENMLLMSLNTNQVNFDDFSGASDVVKDNAIEITVNSSLPYQLNSYLVSPIQNSDKSQTMNSEIFNIRESSNTDFNHFEYVGEKMILRDNCDAGNNNIHNIDMMLKGGIAHQKDIYKTTVKFEVEQI